MLYPVMTKSRMLFDLSGIWAFRMEDEEGQGEREGWAGKPLPQPMTMAVPASYNDMKACAKLRDYHGVVYYQTTVRLDDAGRAAGAPLRRRHPPREGLFKRLPGDGPQGRLPPL